MDMKAKLARFHDVLGRDGVNAALAVLNEGIPHRYTGIFELVGEDLLCRNVYDKLGEPRSHDLDVVKFTDSFCQIAMREGEYRTDNTAMDRRVDGSPYQGVVMSYQGVPLIGHTLELQGTLCHFDVVEQSLSDEEFACLIEAARLLPSYVYAEVRRLQGA